MFDAVAEVIAQTGILRGRGKRCVDSTVFDDAVATQDTVTQLTAPMRKVSRTEWPGPARHARDPHGNYVIVTGPGPGIS